MPVILSNWKFNRMRKLILAGSTLLILGVAGCDQPSKQAEAAKGVDTTIAAPVVESPITSAAAAPAPPVPSEEAAPIEARYTPAYDACMNSGDAANGVTVAMSDCTSIEIGAQDAKLNSTYQRVMRELEEGQRGKLRDAQRAWIRFRDSKCASESQSGGTMDILNSGSCILDATVRRTMELEAMTATK